MSGRRRGKRGLENWIKVLDASGERRKDAGDAIIEEVRLDAHGLKVWMVPDGRDHWQHWIESGIDYLGPRGRPVVETCTITMLPTRHELFPKVGKCAHMIALYRSQG